MMNPCRTIVISSILLLMFVVSLSGCERPSSDSSFENYSERLASVLETNAPPPPKTSIPPLPETNDVLQHTQDIRMGLLDAYELRQCGLFQLIAERNSVLGKVQDRTRQLRYELLLLDGIGHCLTTLAEDSKLHSQLFDVQQAKQTDLPRYFWNMLLAGEEWQKQLKPTHFAFTLDQMPGATVSQEIFRGLAQIAQQITAQQSVPAKTAESLLTFQEAIHAYRYLGRLFYSMARARDWLNATTEMLQKQDSRVYCGPNRNQQKATYLENVFYKFYIDEIQPYLARLDSQYQEIAPDLKTLFATPQRPDSLTDYQSLYIDGALHLQFHQATLNHVTYWQNLFKRCGIKVGQP
ncbi:DUF3080 domain-containing protein [Photobacterium sp. 1_MG-2023]|uniref:DUF3080 domain-containing protein n=1 Tax=Photobacterium sp. 1_MG-2023 TaxID=3062646 RepID=UPI0026E47A72|nr:DUF3080 domain-containing protein [Photobacterium sp. 1_MG-2023]MDO6707995.1 DUF3080 domain-containing protein [Photobacterium sp. 1_MG-2023]